jgi:hypothetical protein
VTAYVPEGIPASMRPKVQRLVGDLDLFAKLHKVQDKDSKREVPFVALPMQERIFAAVRAGHTRIAVIKARQVAATTGCKMAMHHLCYATPYAAMHAIVSMRADSASALLDDHRRWHHHPPKALQRPLRTSSKTQLVYGDTGASIQAFTSRSTTGLRSYTPTAVLLSEFAFAPDQDELLAQATAAVGQGLLIIESTANNPGDSFSRIIAGAPENGWHVITMWWWEHPAYETPAADIPADFVLTEGEKQIQSHYGLNLGQMHWRRMEVATLGEVKFRREYPACMDDCFLGREGGYYSELELADIDVLEFSALGETAGREIEAPNSGDLYVMGVDVGGGVGGAGDFSTIAVVSITTRQPVYTMRSNTDTPREWGHKVVQVASRYNMAFVLAESNNHGHALLQTLQDCRYMQQWRNPKTKKPWVTTLQSKLDAFDTLREALQVIKMMDRVTWMEIRSLTIPAGKLCPEAPTGGNDDAAVAMALAYRALRDAPGSWRLRAMMSQPDRVDTLLAASRARRLRSSNNPFSR